MITQLKSKKYSYWTRLFVLPLSVCLFCAIALYAKTPGKPGGLTTIHKNSVVKTVVPLTVLVDAGHGGEDAGARTSTGLLEKDLCLAIAKQVQQQAASYDLKIIMTRKNDVYPTLRQRTELAAAVKADLIISLHVASSETGNEESGFDIFVTNKNEQLLPRSKQLGSDISDQLKSLYSVGPLKQRKEKGIWILDAAPCPAVLIECGYLTSEKDLAFISNPENQQKIARTILNGVTKYQARNLADAQTQTPLLIASLADTAKPQQNQDELRRKEEQLKQAEAKILELEARQKALEQKHRELEEQNKKMAEARMLDLEAKQKALEQKQRDREQQHKKLAEARMRDIESRQKALDQKNQQMEKENQKRLEEDRKKFESKQKEFESKRRKMDADNEQLSRKAALDHELQKKVFTQKQHEMQLAQKLSADDRLAKVQMAQKALALQKKDMEIQQRKMLEVKRMELKHQEKAIKQHQQELEHANRKMEELKRKEINIQKKMKQAETKETREKESEE